MKTNFRKFLCIILSALMVVGFPISLFHVGATETQNLFENGTFDEDYSNYWTFTTGTTVSIAENAGVDGTPCLHIVNDTTAAKMAKYNKKLISLMETGVAYELSFDYKTVGVVSNSKKPKLKFFGTSENIMLNDSTTLLDSAADWTHVSYEVTSNGTPSGNKIQELIFTILASTELYFDNFSLTKKVSGDNGNGGGEGQQPPLPATNIVENGNFDEDSDYTPYWTFTAGTTVSIAENVGVDGTSCLRIVNDSTAAKMAKYNKQLISLMETGVAYKLSFDYKTVGVVSNSKKPKLKFFGTNDNVMLNDSTTLLDSAADWTHISYEVMSNGTPSNNKVQELIFTLMSSTELYLDNFSLMKKVYGDDENGGGEGGEPPATEINLVKNGDFENFEDQQLWRDGSNGSYIEAAAGVGKDSTGGFRVAPAEMTDTTVFARYQMPLIEVMNVGKPYELSFWYKTGGNGTAKPSVQFGIPDNLMLGDTQLERTNEWTYVSYRVTSRSTEVPSNRTKSQFCFTVTKSVGEFCVDNIVLKQLDGKPAESITISPKAMSVALNSGAKASLSAVVLPDDADQLVTWTSSDETIAKVSAGVGITQCNITPVAVGTVTITAKTTNGLTDTATITVIPEVPVDLSNLFINGNFEIGDDSWLLPAGSMIENGMGYGTPPGSGLKITGSDSKELTVRYRKELAAKMTPGTTYELSFWYKTSVDATTRLRLNFGDTSTSYPYSPNGMIAANSMLPSTDGEWKQISMIVQGNGIGSTGFDFYFKSTKGVGVIYIDDVSLKTKDGVHNLFPNGDFEFGGGLDYWTNNDMVVEGVGREVGGTPGWGMKITGTNTSVVNRYSKSLAWLMEKNKPYELSFWYRTTGPSYLRVIFGYTNASYPNSYNPMVKETTLEKTDGEWKQASFIVTSNGKGAIGWDLTLIAGAGNGDVFIDDLSLVRAEESDVTSVTIQPETLAVRIGSATVASLNATILPANSDKTLTWTSSNEGVATVAPGGAVGSCIITPIFAGKTTITATSVNGITATAEVTVVDSTIDLAVTELTTTNEWPKPGEKVSVAATVTNVSEDQEAPKGVHVKFMVDGVLLATEKTAEPLPAGGSEVVFLNVDWEAIQGSHTISAVLDSSVVTLDVNTANDYLNKNVHVAETKLQIPEPAASAGYNTLTFSDDFDSLATIDVNATGGVGYKWYTDIPYARPNTSSNDYSVQDSAIKIATPSTFALPTYSTKSRVGFDYTFGYLEVRFRYDPTIPKTKYWPAIWSIPKAAYHSEMDRSVELDFFEAVKYGGAFTVHDRRLSDKTEEWWASAAGGAAWPGKDYQILGVLWEKGSLTWYLNGEVVHRLLYSEDDYSSPAGTRAIYKGMFSPLDEHGATIILGADTNWPMEVDYVRVWQSGNGESGDSNIQDGVQDPTETKTTTVTGKLFDQYGNTISDGWILMQPGYLVESTDAEGNFSFKDIEPGTYKIYIYDEVGNEIESTYSVEISEGENLMLYAVWDGSSFTVSESNMFEGNVDVNGGENEVSPDNPTDGTDDQVGGDTNPDNEVPDNPLPDDGGDNNADPSDPIDNTPPVSVEPADGRIWLWIVIPVAVLAVGAIVLSVVLVKRKSIKIKQ